MSEIEQNIITELTREKDRLAAEFAACRALLIAAQKRGERAEAERAEWKDRAEEAERRALEAAAKYERIVGLHTEEERLRWKAETKAINAEQKASEARAALSEIETVLAFTHDAERGARIANRALAALPVEPARPQVTEIANALGAPSARSPAAVPTRASHDQLASEAAAWSSGELSPHDWVDAPEAVPRVAAIRAQAFEEAAKVAEKGGCDCPKAPCEHDEVGRHIAWSIRAFASAEPARSTSEPAQKTPPPSPTGDAE